MQRLIPKDLMQKIYQMWLNGHTAKDLAEEYGMHSDTMQKYLRQFEKGVVKEWQ